MSVINMGEKLFPSTVVFSLIVGRYLVDIFIGIKNLFL